MSPRYLLIVGRDDRAREAIAAQLSNCFGLQIAFSNSQIAVLANRACGCIAVGDAGCVLGSLFHRHGPAERLAGVSSDDAVSIASSGGQALLSGYFGGYVAAIAGPRSTTVLRDPSGTFPCYGARLGAFTILASDADILVASGLPIELDLEEVGRQLYRAFVPSTSTALRGIYELLPGFRLRDPMEFDQQEACWSPWTHVTDRGAAPETAAEHLARVIRHSVEACASGQGRLLLSVSGGLDSSIIAASLATSGTDTVCLTMFSDDPAGDERSFSRALCDRLGLQLIERPYRLEDIDITEPLGAHLPRPRDRTQANAYERVHLDVAAEIGADAFVTGNGGDNVLGYSQSAAPIADRYIAEGLTAGTYQTLLDVCRQTGCSLFDALGHAWRLVHGSWAHQVRANLLFLDPEFVAHLGAAELRHPWLDAPPDALPGKAAHISAILRVQPNIEASRGAHLPVMSPLMSQPIVEACLEIPTWEWRAGGRDRALARRAFAADLPAAVLNRRVKGTPGQFAARVLDHFRRPIRDRLLGGRLAAHRIIDTWALEHILAGDRPVPDLERVRILELVNAEAWIEHWTSRRQGEPSPRPLRSDDPARPRASGGPTR